MWDFLCTFAADFYNKRFVCLSDALAKYGRFIFLLTALLAIAQGAWAATVTFTNFKKGNNTQGPVTIPAPYGYMSGGIYIHSQEIIDISVSTGYTITEVKFTVDPTNYITRKAITATYGTLSNNTPNSGETVTVSNVNNTQTVLSSPAGGNYLIIQVQVTYAAIYTVTFNKQNGTGGSNSVTAIYGSAMPSATMPTRTGYTFGGYFTGTGGSGTKYYNANGSSAKNWDQTSNKTLYAKWTANTYTVSFNKQSGTGGSNSVTATYGSAMPSITKPTRTGYTFGGYYTGTGGSGTQYYNANGGSVRSWDLSSNTTLYAKWIINPASVTTAPTAKTNLTYNGSAQALVNAGAASNGTMNYRIGTSGSWSTSIPTATNAGSYTVQYYAQGTGGASNSGTGSVQVTIAQANPTVTAPTANANLTYSGSAQALVNAGSTTGGTMKYSLDNSTWNTSIPTGTNAGSYTVYYKVEGNSNYNGNNGSNFQVTIAKSSTTTIATVPAAIENLEYTGDAQPLATAGSSPDGTMMYSLDGTNWSEDIPTGTAVGDYTVYYYVKGDANHNDGAVQSFNVSIAEKASAAMGDSGDNTVVGADISSFLAAQHGHTIENVAIVRPVYRNTYYNTLCLPFDLPSLTGTILDGFKVMELSGISVSGGTLHVELEETTSVVAGKPYFVKYEAETDILNQLDFTDVTINNANLIDNAVTFGDVTFRGTFAPYAMEAQTEENHSYLFLGQNDVLYWPNANGNLLSFRAFFVINTGANNSPIRRGMPARIVEGKNVATGVENVQGDNVQSTKVLENGVLYIIKNGVKYNAQGQEVR